MHKILLGFLLLVGCSLVTRSQSCMNANLELAGVTGTFPTGNGPDTSAQLFTFSNNVNNPTDNIMSTYSPTTTVKFSLSNQQFTNMAGLAVPKTGMAFGRTFNAGSAKTSGQSGVNSNPATNYTSNNYATGSGITGTNTVTATSNVGTWLMINDGNGLAGTNQRPYYGDLTITFNNPVNYPVLHFNDFGGITAGKQFVAEYEMTSGYSMTKLSGGASILVAGDTIKGTPQSLQSGSIRINGTGITSITFKVYLKSNSTSNWGASTGGDAMVIGVSIPSTVPLQPVLTKSTITNVCPNTSVNLNMALPGTIPGLSYEWHTVATNANAGNLINNPTTYSGSSPVYLFAKDSLTGCYSISGDTLAVNIVNCTYTISCTGTTVFREDFGSANDNLDYGVSGADHPYDSTFCINGFITNNTAGYIGSGVNFTNDVAGDGDTGTHFLAHFTGVGGAICGNAIGAAAWKNNATINVIAGQVYEFSYYYRAQNNTSSFTVIQQQIIPASGTITKLDSTYLPIQNATWVKNTMRFTASASGPVTLRLNNMLGPVGGNDFALDNIALTAVPLSMSALNDTIFSSCPSGTYNLSTLLPPAEPGYTYEWHTVSSNPGASTIISNPSAATGSGPFYLYTTGPGGCYSIPDTVTAVQSTCPPTFGCTGNTYLVQSLPTDLYNLNINGGTSTSVIQNLTGTTAGLGINSIGYNATDGYLWGGFDGGNKVARIGADGTTTFYTITGLPASNVGDVSNNGILYLYTTNTSTIYRVDVNPTSPSYLQLLTPNLTTTVYAYADWAFNPLDGQLYALTLSKSLVRINPSTGVAVNLGVVSGGTPALADAGGWGGAFFDDLGNFYVSGNSSGNIHKITGTATAVAGATYPNPAVFVSQGPTSANNDGARCNTAPLCTVPANPVAGNSSLYNTCPATTVNLTTLQPAPVAGVTYEWHTVGTNPLSTTLVTNPGAVSTIGTYYLFAKSNAGSCYSNAGDTVVVTIYNPCTDCDGDGVPNQVDIDDDNDGVLDLTESCAVPNFTPNATWASLNGTTVAAKSGSVSVTTVQTSGSAVNNVSYLSSGNCAGTPPDWGHADINFSAPVTNATFYIEAMEFGTEYAVLEVMPPFTGTPALGYTALFQGATLTQLTPTSWKLSSGANCGISSGCNSAGYIQITGAYYNKIHYSGGSLTNNTWCRNLRLNLTDAVVQGSCSSDYDNDGIPNECDTDSDGDGCPDAYESGASINKTSFTVAGPYGLNGLANSLESNDNGNATINYSSTYATYTKDSTNNKCNLADCDNDGVANLFDTDDDNDGVLDVTEAASVYYMYDYINTGTQLTFSRSLIDITTKAWLEKRLLGVGYTSAANYSFYITPGGGSISYQALPPATGATGTFSAASTVNTLAAINAGTFLGVGMNTTTTFGFFKNGSTIQVENLTTAGALSTYTAANVDNTLAAKAAGNLLGITVDPATSFAYGIYKSGTTLAWERLNDGVTGTYTAAFSANTIAAFNNGSLIGIDHGGAVNEVAMIYNGIDTDNDGILNTCDTDSDGDGCPDAYEGGATAVKTQTTFAGPYGLNGLANSLENNDSTTATVNYTSSFNTYGFDSTLATGNKCNLADCDNDGIPNAIDIDDDNDGVLDVVEMNCEKISNGYFNGNVTLGWTYTGNVAVSSNLLNFNSGNTAPNGTATQVIPTVAGQNLTLTYTISASAITTLGVKVDIIDSATNVVLATRSIIKNAAPATSNEQVNFVAAGAKTKIVFTDISTVTNGVDIYIDNVSILYCDNDNDGIPNSCDLDSDNDGCPDAVEAGATSIKTQSTFAGPYGLNGLANSVENNDSLSANIANEPYFLVPNYGSYASNPNTIICADDCDNDGVPNEWDIDDDNDGVLDALESCNLLVENFGAGTAAAIPNANTLVTSTQASVVSAVPAHAGNAWFSGQLDHTPNDVNGNMLFIYNVSSPTVVYTRTISNLVVGRKYNFSAYIANPMQAGWMSPNITFIVRDASNAIIGQYNTGNLLNGSFNWQKYGFEVIATSTTAKIEIVDNVTSVANNNLGQDDIAIDDISFGICDYDNDGIPNNCDTDDDNDGCPTAYEAGATSANTQTTFAGPYGTNGLAASLENNDGPNATTSYANSYLNIAQDSTIKACEDCDNDGVSNVTDIDDDNDGVLDVVECPASRPYKIYTHNYTNAAFVTNLPVKITGSIVKNYTLDQSASQTDLTYAGVGWKLMASNVYSDTAKKIKIEMLPTPLTTGTYIIADAMLITNGVDTIMINDADAGFTKTGTWTAQAVAGSIAGTNWFAQVPFVQTATWTFSNVENPKSACDKDNDGLVNTCDLDSDGDGCPDAYEGGATAVKTQTTFAGPYGNNGLANSLESNDSINATTSYPLTYAAYALDSSIATGNKCNLPDSDNDGVTDNDDLDDDNDGILDEVENASCNYVTNGSMESYSGCPNLSIQGTIDNAIGWMTTGGIASTYGQLMVYDPPNCISNKPASSWLATTALTGGSDGKNWLGGHTIEDWQNTLTSPLPIGTYNLKIDAGNVINSPYVSTSTILYVYGLKSTDANFASPAAQLLGSFTVNNVLSSTNQTWATYSFNFTTTQVYDRIHIVNNPAGALTYTYIDNFRLNSTGCIADADGDGIPNSLDLDSDGDGCPDAREGGADFTAANLVNSSMPGGNGGAGYTGTSSSPVTQNLGNTVGNTSTTMGVPTIANTGQLKGSSQNGTLNACDDCDNDGVTNVLDIDDDNDGVLDVVECPSSQPYKVYLFSRNAASPSLSTNIPVSIVGKTTQNVLIDQVNAGTDLSMYGYSWKLLESNVVSDATNKITVSMVPTATTNGTFILADGMLITNGTNTYVIDNTDAGFTQTGFPVQNIAGAYNNNENFSTAPHTGHIATWTFTNILNASACDKDNDGITNTCDLDSDGDGCPDAYEGGATLSQSQTTFVGPYGTNGLANSIETNDSLNAKTTYTNTFTTFGLDSTLSKCKVDTSCGAPSNIVLNGDMNGTINTNTITNWTNTGVGTLWFAKPGVGTNIYAYNDHDAAGTDSLSQNIKICELPTNDVVLDFAYSLREGPPGNSSVFMVFWNGIRCYADSTANGTAFVHTISYSNGATGNIPSGTFSSSASPIPWNVPGTGWAHASITIPVTQNAGQGLNGRLTFAHRSMFGGGTDDVFVDSVIVKGANCINAGSDITACNSGTVNLTGKSYYQGTTTWTAAPANPGTSSIANAALTSTTVSGFSTAGTYKYILSNGTCSDTVSVVVSNCATPDTSKVTPACPTCPINTCVVADDLTPGGQTYTTCGTPNGYSAVGPDANGCITYTPNGPNTTPDTTCIVACKNGVCDTTYIIINPPVTPDTNKVTPACPTCPINTCVVADDIIGGAIGATFTTCPLPPGYTKVGPDANGCVTYTGPSTPGISPVTTCIVACKNGICDTTYVIINPPVTPDTVTKTPTCPTCPINVCVVADDIVGGASGATFTTCPLPPGYTKVGPDAIGWVTYTGPSTPGTSPVTTCIVACKNGVCDTTYVIINPPVTPDTVTKTPSCPTCPINACVVADDITGGASGSTFTTCPLPPGYTKVGPDANGCVTYTGPSTPGTSPVTTCIVACKNGVCDTTYIIINPPVTPDTVTKTPTCPTCPINVCVVADDIVGGSSGATFTTCPLPPGYTKVGPDANGCVTYTGPSTPVTSPVTTCIVACKNGVCDTTYVIINPPVTPDTNKITPACPTCPISTCVVADDLTPGGQTYTSCGTPNGYTAVGPNASGCITYTPNGPNTTPDTTCIVACKNGVCDTTFIIISPPVKPDTVIKTPACPTCPVTVCQVINDVTIGAGATFSSCPTPAGYTATPTDVNGCKTYTPSGTNTTPDTTCQVICKNGICDTTYVIINPPVTPDTNKVTPSCPTCPLNTCVVADDLTPGGQTYTACSTPPGYTQVGPDVNGCITLTPLPGASGGTSCIVACKNGVCDTTYIIINPPVSPDTIIVKPACPTCPVTVCQVLDDITNATGATFNACPAPAGYTEGPVDANGCKTFTPNGSVTTTVTTCQVICKNGICDTTYIIIQPPVTPDTVITTPACPTCPVTICQVLDDVPSATGATFSSCPPPPGYTLGPINALGCRTYTPNGTVTTPVTTCQVICKNGVCDTTYIIINPPITPDTVRATPACPTCPVTVCQILDDITSATGATFSSCPTPAGYTAGPIDANGCRTLTPNGTVTNTVTTCQVICKNGICDTTYIIIDKPITPDTNKVTPACPTCPVNTCVLADDLTPGGQTYTTCGTPNGYTAVGPDANGCITYTPNGPNSSPDTTCIVACKNGKCDTTYVIINPPVTPDSVTVQPTCPTCPVKACVIGDDLPSLTGATFTSCGLSATDATKGQLVLDLQGCLIWVGNGLQGTSDTIKTCVVACKNGVCDTTYVNILPAVPPYGPDSIYTTPTCSTCPTPSVCVTGDDIPVAATNITYTSCGLTPSSSTQGSLNFNSTTGCVIWTPNPTQTDTVKTCVIVCGEVTVSTVTTTVCDTTYMFFPPPPKPDTITKTPACPSCAVIACPTADNITITSSTVFSTCATPAGFTVTGPDAAGCMTYTPTSMNSSPVTTCVVACNGAICDTTYVIINPPITPDTNTVRPACPTCPVTTCVQADDLTSGGQTFSTCGAPSNYSQSVPDVNGCITLTPQNVTTGGTTCIVACKNGTCDTTYIIILPPITPDTNYVIPTCATCPVTTCVQADDLTPGGQTYTSCSSASGYTQTAPDANGCITISANAGTSSGGTTCIVACKNGVCDTTYIIINLPDLNKLNPDFNNTFVNVPVSGNIKTNDVIVDPGTTYGTPTPISGNPGTCVPAMSPTGTYTFTCATPGEYNYWVPVCPTGVTVNCPQELLTITVLDPNTPLNPPGADPDYGTTKQDTPITIDVKANDQCNNGPTCSLSNPTIVDSANHGSVIVNPDGTIKYTPNPGFTGKDTLQYKVCDNETPVPKCDTEYVFIDVLPTSAPNSTTAMDDYKKGGMGEAVTGNVKTNDTDPEANNQTVTPQNILIPGKGTFVLNPDGTYTFTPVDTFKGPIDIIYTTCDDGTPQACSNATLHILIAQPDVSPNISATPNIMHGTTSFNVTVKVTELNMVKTNGLITVRIPKDYRLSFTYNPAAIKIGFTNVSNSVWTYSSANPFFHIFTTTTVIPKGGFSTFGFVASFAPGSTNGKYTMSSTISSGSGSENRINNNVDSESLDYFHN